MRYPSQKYLVFLRGIILVWNLSLILQCLKINWINFLTNYYMSTMTPAEKPWKTGNGTGTHIVGAQRRVQRTPAGKWYNAAPIPGHFLLPHIQLCVSLQQLWYKHLPWSTYRRTQNYIYALLLSILYKSLSLTAYYWIHKLELIECNVFLFVWLDCVCVYQRVFWSLG